MAFSYTDNIGDGSTTTFSFSFTGPDDGYISNDEVHVYEDGVETVDFTFHSVSQVTMDTAPADGVLVRIIREIDADAPYTDFERGNSFGKDNINNSFRTQLYLLHSIADGFKEDDYYEKQDLSMGTDYKITDMADGVDDQDAVTVGQINTYLLESAASAAAALVSENAAEASNVEAGESAVAAAASEAAAALSESAASSSESSASTSATNAAASAVSASESAASISANAVSLADLRLITGIEEQTITMYGILSIGDGGGGKFVWDATSIETDNTGTIIKATATTIGRWKRIFDDEVDVKWFGAVGDGTTDDTAAIQKALDNYDKVFLSEGSYLVSSVLTMDRSNMIFRGSVPASSDTAHLISTVSTDVIDVSGTYNCSVVGIKINDSGSAGICINLSGGENHDILYCDIYTTHASKTDPHIYFKGSNTNIKNCTFNNTGNTAMYMVECGRGAGLICINNAISECYFGGVGNGVLVEASSGYPRPEGLLINNCVFLNTNVHVKLSDLLSGRLIGNMFDQASDYSIAIVPGEVGVSQVTIEGNYISTAQTDTTGVGVGNSGTGDCSDISIINNHICYCGYGIAFNSSASNINVASNQFSVIEETCVTLNEATNGIITGNSSRNVAGYSLSLTDGSAGGPFTVVANHFDSTYGVYLTKTTASNFTIQYNYGYITNDDLNTTDSPTFTQVTTTGQVIAGSSVQSTGYENASGTGGARLQSRSDLNAISFDWGSSSVKIYVDNSLVVTLPTGVYTV